MKKAISLVALVITIIVVLILAATVVMMALGENGIITRAQAATEAHNFAMSREKVILEMANLKIKAAMTGENVIEYLDNPANAEDVEKLARKKIIYNHEESATIATFAIDRKYIVTTDLNGNIQATIKMDNDITITDIKITTDLLGNNIAENGVAVGTKLYIWITVENEEGEEAIILPEIPFEITENGEYSFTVRVNENKATPCNVTVSNYASSGTNPVQTTGGWNGTIETPKLVNGMTGIYWNGDTETIISGADDSNWYDYAESPTGRTSRWANAKTVDGSYWVWIPRFEYKITPKADGEEAGTIDINFISKETTTATTGYTIHPTFRNDLNAGGWDSELAGIWVAKYEMSEGTGETVKSVPGVLSISSNIADCYNYARGYNEGLESHLMKNSEWGAVAYLTHSKYGKNAIEEVARNVYLLDYESYTAGGELTPTLTNKIQSSNGNETGVFDLNGGKAEFVAAYNTQYPEDGELYGGENGKENEAFGPTFGEPHFAYTMQDVGGISSKYVTAYTSLSEYVAETNCKVGDATYETEGWYEDNAECVDEESPFFIRGGSYEGGNAPVTTDGIFCSELAEGGEDGYIGFRVVLVID